MYVPVCVCGSAFTHMPYTYVSVIGNKCSNSFQDVRTYEWCISENVLAHMKVYVLL